MSGQVEGGCQCGRVRYAADATDAEAYLCHCRMCRRATGGPSAAMVAVARAGVTWSREPDWYASSPIARRPFCATCGTPLGFLYVDDETRISLTLGSFDAPERFAPTRNYSIEGMLPAWLDASHLPGSRTEDDPAITRRWIDAVGKLPD